jgi:hypothetical protein
MRARRRQFTIGTLMIGIAILAVCFSVPEISGGLLALALTLVILIVIALTLFVILMVPLFALVEMVDRWLGRRDQSRRSRRIMIDHATPTTSKLLAPPIEPEL